MRAVTFCAFVVVAGCARPAPVEEEPAEEEPVRAITDTPKPSHVPQDEYNLGQLERTRQSSDPLHKDLANGRFKFGDRIEAVTAVYPPDLLLTHGEYTTAVYAGGRPLASLTHVCVIARYGKLVRAFGSSCVWHPVFFDGLTDAERTAWSGGYQAVFNKHFGLPNPAPPAPPAPADDAVPPPREVVQPKP
jgi:hypothetical protein